MSSKYTIPGWMGYRRPVEEPEGKRTRFVSFHYDRLIQTLKLALQLNDTASLKVLLVQLIPVLVRIPELMLASARLIYSREEAFQLSYLRFLQLCFAKLPGHRIAVLEQITTYNIRHGRLQEAYDYLDGHMTSPPFNEATVLLALHFQMALQLSQRETRPAVKQRAFKRVGACFEAYMASSNPDPRVCRLFYDILLQVGTTEEELRSVLETLLDLCPGSFDLRSQLVLLLLKKFKTDRNDLVQQGFLLLQQASSLGVPLDSALLSMIQDYYTQNMVTEWNDFL